MYRILWHNIQMIITIFPGIILFLVNRFSFFHRKNEMDKYILCLMLVVYLNLICNVQYLIILLLIPILTIVLFIIDYILTEWENISLSKFKYAVAQMKKPVYIMIFYPIFEEIIYRYFIYYYLKESVNVAWFYVLISSIAFVFAHFFNQRFKCFFKLPLAVAQGIVFLVYQNIFICIIIHICYNILVFSYNMSKYSKGKIY